MTFLYLLVGINIGILLTLVLQATLIAVLMYTTTPRDAIINRSKAMAEEVRRRIKGRAVMIQTSSPIEQQMHEVMQRRTVPNDV